MASNKSFGKDSPTPTAAIFGALPIKVAAKRAKSGLSSGLIKLARSPRIKRMRKKHKVLSK